MEHTRTSTNAGPDYCHECSNAIHDWVKWPCEVVRLTEENEQLRATLVVVTDELRKHGYGDFHYTPSGWRDPEVLAAIATAEAVLNPSALGSVPLPYEGDKP